MTEQTTLTIDVRQGERLSLDGGRVLIELVRKSGQLARLKVSAPKEVAIKKDSALQVDN